MRRISAYGVCLDEEGRVLLARTGDGRWTVPGGVVDHGADPRSTVREAFAAQVGVSVRVDSARDVLSEIVDGSPVRHDEWLVFDVRTSETVTADSARWAGPADLDTLPLTARAARLLGRAERVDESDEWSVPDGPSAVRRQRFAAYALATDPKGNVLLALISPGYPMAGRWHLPGGGTHPGEPAVVGMLRELAEETGQTGRVESVLHVDAFYDARALGPEGHPVDFHSVSVVYRVRVSKPTAATVTDAGGSTASAGWFAPDEALTLELTPLARAALLRALAAR